jgi:DNA-binding transcriptional LysR family regulator
MLSAVQLEALDAFASEGSIAGAAARLGYTPSAVSQQLASLERRTGLRLLDRGARAAALTPHARALLPSARAALQALSAVEAEAARLGGAAPPQVLAAFPSAVGALVPHVLATLSQTEPGAGVRVDELEPADAVAALRSAEADVAVGYDFCDRPLDCSGLERTEIGTDPFRLYVPAGHALARSGRVPLAAVAGQPWVADGPAGPRECFAVRHLEALGLAPSVAARSNDTLTVMRLVAQGVGLALLPALQGTAVDGAVPVELEDPPPPRRIFAAVSATARRGRRAAALLASVRDSASTALAARS